MSDTTNEPFISDELSDFVRYIGLHYEIGTVSFTNDNGNKCEGRIVCGMNGTIGISRTDIPGKTAFFPVRWAIEHAEAMGLWDTEDGEQ